MGFDPILLVALGAGALVGRLLPSRGPWPGRAIVAVVLLLLFALGTSIGTAADAALLAALPVGVGLAALTLALTAAVALILRRRSPRGLRGTGAPPATAWSGIAYAGAVGVGFGLERVAGVSLGGTIEPLLWALVAIVAYDLRWTGASLRRWWAPLAAAVVGAASAAVLGAIAFHLPLAVAFATTGAFGFYSLAGPLVAARFGASLGFAAFLANFLRENTVMISSPWVGGALGGEGLAALGGATSMDTTLYFVTRFGDRDAGSLALATGLVLTIAASLLLPVLVALPGP